MGEEHPDPIVRVEAKLDEVLKIMNGNGQIGLCAKISILWKGALFIVGAVVLIAIKGFM